ncbi:Protein kinase domain-containing protein [Pararobbsia alpina]|uniref:helix-hairpin-helix domain-containing protein n=1 Tax=Pararobbsia alpina TaxID=621374 RepID=UPI0039A5409D
MTPGMHGVSLDNTTADVAERERVSDSKGREVSLGELIGEGGEGRVYALRDAADHVAKLYREPLPARRQAKLHAMTALGDSYLRTIAAWPVEVLRGEGSRVVGFTMPRVEGHEPIHHLYSPAQRKQFFPQADYAFLVAAARNVAAAFDAIHAHGHVVGDVNQGNVVIRRDSVACFIDCDSFEIQAHGTRFACEVGVQHFTPPELQAIKAFGDAPRMANHDRFGLAVLVFHLLFMGRHPYAGIHEAGDMSIEQAIAEYRFAYGPRRQARGMQTPPHALALETVSPTLAAMFEAAFTEVGARQKRPDARQWVHALEAFGRSLRTCSTDAIHRFPAHLRGCPWCEIESRTGTQYFLPTLPPPGTRVALPDNADIQQVWQRIVALGDPQAEAGREMPELFTSARHLHAHAAVPNLMNAGSDAQRPRSHALRIRRRIARLVSFALTVGSIAVSAADADISLAFGFAGPLAWVACALVAERPFRREYVRRRGMLNAAQHDYDVLLARYRKLRHSRAFADKFHALEHAKRGLDALPRRYQGERQKLFALVRERQLEKFLASHVLVETRFASIGPGRKATLASFGIETAADVADPLLGKVRGLGEAARSELRAWRAQMEARFTFDPQSGTDPRDLQWLTWQFANRRTRIEKTLREGLRELQKLDIENQRARLQALAELQGASTSLARAEADYRALAGAHRRRRLKGRHRPGAVS